MLISSLKKYLVKVACLALLFLPVCASSGALEKVSLQLDWKFQFEFAGFIMAKEKGFYEAVGLDVDLLEYQVGTETVSDVLSQKKNYGLFNSSIVIDEGKVQPTILMATYFQRSPLIFVTTKDIKHPSDLIGKTIMGTTVELNNSSLALLLDHFSINSGNTKFQGHSFSVNDFITHKVDAMSVFRTNELFELDRKGIEYNIIDPEDYGFSMSAVNMFTSPREALSHPDRTRDFIAASNRGWAYALAHPDEAINVIYDHYSQEKSIEALQYEAKITRNTMLLDLFDIGETNKELSLRALKQLQFSGTLSSSEKLGNFIFEDVVREFNEGVNFTEEQRLYLQEKKEITMCIDPDWMPFESLENGKHIGIASEIIAQFNDQIPIPITLVPTNSWQESLSNAQDRRCDIWSLASETPSRKKYMDFTSPYIDTPIVMATKTTTPFINDITTIQEKRLGIVKGYAVAEQLRNKMPDINIVEVSSLADGLARVERGELFGYIGNFMGISHAIQKEFTGTLKISARLDHTVELAIGSRNDQPQLNEILEVLVKSISEERLQAAHNKWVAAAITPSFNYSLMWKWLVAMLILSAAYLYRYQKLTQFNRKLLMLSATDSLTGIYNRAKIDEVLIQHKAAVDRHKTKLAIILLDIDYFKAVNDRYGHLVGDEVLIEFSQLLNDGIRITDDVGRWGGEEFLIICPNINTIEASELAKKLLQNIRDHSFSRVGKITASAGVGELSKELDIRGALQNVDKALYEAKENGRNQVVIDHKN